MVRAALFSCTCLAAAPVEACRLALVLALDVSSSVDADEHALLRQGMATALLAPEVEAAFFASPDPVAIQIFEWSGQRDQANLLNWTMVREPDDLRLAAQSLVNNQRSFSTMPTALGYALGYASIQLRDAPACLFQTIDMAGDGVNNDGFGPASAYAAFAFDGVTVNGLAITGSEDGLQRYYENEVIRGSNAFVEVAAGFADFEDAMRRKLVRELSAQIIGRIDDGKEVAG